MSFTINQVEHQASSSEEDTVEKTTVSEIRRRQLQLSQSKKKRRKRKRRRKKKKRKKNKRKCSLLGRKSSKPLLVGLDSQYPEKHRSKFVHLQVVLAASLSEHRTEETTAAA